MLPGNAVDLSGTGKSVTLPVERVCLYVPFGARRKVGCPSDIAHVGDGPVVGRGNSRMVIGKLDWAVDGQGNHVWLPSVDFIKVQSGMLQN